VRRADLGQVVGLDVSTRPRLDASVAQVLLWVSPVLLLAGVMVTAEPLWLRAVGVGGGLLAILFRPVLPEFGVPSFPRMLIFSVGIIVVLLVETVFGGAPLTVGGWLLVSAPFTGAVAIGLALRNGRVRDAWICCTGGLIRTDVRGAEQDAFGWDRVATLSYGCQMRSVPSDGEYRFLTTDEFTLTLDTGAQYGIRLSAVGPPHLLCDLGRPNPVSTLIAEGVSEAQLLAAQPVIAAGDAVAFGPVTVSSAGLGIGGGVLAWSQIERVQMQEWATMLVYNPRAQVVPRTLRLFIDVTTEPVPDGPDPSPRWRELTDVADVGALRRVRLADGQPPASVRLVATERQIPNVFTFMRLLRQFGVQ
jgi:hypothetical protein